MKKPTTEAEKQIYYRDARAKGYYGEIWTTTGKCVFCDLRDKYIFYEENGVVLTVAVFAYIDGHFMIIPRQHTRSVKDLTPTQWETVRKFMYIAKKLIRKAHDIKGMQIVMKDGLDAQSTVEHLHIHCIPFDAPDLAEWHYRDLKNTPAKNAEIYRDLTKDIGNLSKRFEEKYGS